MNNDKLLLRPAEVAQMLSISRSKVYDLINKGIIPSTRLAGIIRVPASKLVDLIERSDEGASQRG
jgi:excisionase family DNA binding protein